VDIDHINHLWIYVDSAPSVVEKVIDTNVGQETTFYFSGVDCTGSAYTRSSYAGVQRNRYNPDLYKKTGGFNNVYYRSIRSAGNENCTNQNVPILVTAQSTKVYEHGICGTGMCMLKED
jgi:hypothetical protein